MNRLTMLAVTLMASIACFAQGKGGEATGWTADSFGPDYQELKYNVTVGSPHQVSVIGFADGILANPQWMVTPPDDPKVAIVANTVTIYHYLPGDIGENLPAVWNHGVEANAFKSVDADLASNVTKLSIEYVNNNTTEGNAVTIGENAFSGLTSLATVISAIPGDAVQPIPESAFAANVYKTAKLMVPAGSLAKYADEETEGWNKFYLISDGEVTLGDLEEDGEIDALDVKELKKMILNGTYSAAADLNGDGDIDALDLKKMKQIILGTY